MKAEIKRKEQYTLVLDSKNSKTFPGHRKVRQRSKDDGWWYLGAVGQIGYSIALPIAGGALLGEYIDRVRSTYPKATLLFLLIGSVLSFLGFVITIRDLIKRDSS